MPGNSDTDTSGRDPTIKVDIKFHRQGLTPSEQSVVSAGFLLHTREQDAPEYNKQPIKWLALDEQESVLAVLTADILWDWIYIDELWVSPDLRGKGIGQRLMQHAEEFAKAQNIQGIWLWTQSWQAKNFYERLGYSEFTRFEDFPTGHSRIGFRKKLETR